MTMSESVKWWVKYLEAKEMAESEKDYRRIEIAKWEEKAIVCPFRPTVCKDRCKFRNCPFNLFKD